MAAIRVVQSTRPRGARPPELLVVRLLNEVSIHAPTRGATQTEIVNADLTDVSIHAPTRGATQFVQPGHRTAMRFNPRAHAGRDLKLRTSCTGRGMFQSTRPRGARRRCARCSCARVMFQSTRPR